MRQQYPDHEHDHHLIDKSRIITFQQTIPRRSRKNEILVYKSGEIIPLKIEGNTTPRNQSSESIKLEIDCGHDLRRIENLYSFEYWRRHVQVEYEYLFGLFEDTPILLFKQEILFAS